MGGFDKRSAERIKDFVVFTERVSRSTTPRQRRHPQPASNGRWVTITSESGGKYSWTGLDASGNASTDWGSGDHSEASGYARELTGSTDVISNDLVWLEPAKAEPYFLFYYQPELKLGNLTSSISARSGSTPGTGTVTIQTYSGSLSDSTSTTVYSNFTTVVTGPRYVTIEYSGGVWWITGADCDTYSS